MFDPENIALDWLGSLILVHYHTTRATIEILQTGAKLPRISYSSQTDGNTNLFWVWWPGPKQYSIVDWLFCLGALTEPKMETLKTIRRILPIHIGFYRGKLAIENGRLGLYLEDGSTVFYEFVDESDFEHFFVRPKGHHPIFVLEDLVSYTSVKDHMEIEVMSGITRLFIVPSDFQISAIGGIMRSDVGSTDSVVWAERECIVCPRRLQELHSAAYENTKGLLKLVKD